MLSRVVVAVGIVVALVALVTARYGFLFVAVIVIGLGAAMGPGRSGKRRHPACRHGRGWSRRRAFTCAQPLLRVSLAPAA